MASTTKDLTYADRGRGLLALEAVRKTKKAPPAAEDSFTFALFQDVLDDAYEKGIEDEDIASSAKWFFNKAQKLRYGDPDDIMSARERQKAGIQYGKMYHFFYLAKHADSKKLPYWDMFPLVFPIDPKPGGFLGINLHYLPPQLRIQLMSRLYDLAAGGKYDKRTKLVISYQILKAASGMSAFKPCVKWYLSSYVQSPFVQLYYNEWAMAAALPTQRFQKASDRKVWSDSRRKISLG